MLWFSVDLEKKIETLLWGPKLLSVHILWRCLCVSSVKGPCFPPLVAHLLCVPGDDASSLASLDATPGRSATWNDMDVSGYRKRFFPVEVEDQER